MKTASKTTQFETFLHILCPQDWCVSEILIPIRFWHPKTYVSEISDMYHKILICIIKKYISDISDMHQKNLICIRNFWYVSEISDMYHKILICIIKFLYVSEISDMYQKKLICIRNFWYVSEISDMYHKILICIIKFWYVSEISDTYFFKMHQKFLISFKNKQQMHIVRNTPKKITWAAGSRQP